MLLEQLKEYAGRLDYRPTNYVSKPVRYVIILNLSLTPCTPTIHAILSVSPPHIVTCRAATKSGLDASPGGIMDKLRTLKNNFKG